MVLLQHCCSVSFHTKKLCSRLFRSNLNFIHKNDKFAFWATLWGVRNTSSIARLKARCRIPIRDNCIFFAHSYGWEVVSRYWSKSAFFNGVGHFDCIFNVEEDVTLTNVGIRKLEWFSFYVASKCRYYVLSVRHKAVSTCMTDRQTDRITTPKTALALLRRPVKTTQCSNHGLTQRHIAELASGNKQEELF